MPHFLSTEPLSLSTLATLLRSSELVRLAPEAEQPAATGAAVPGPDLAGEAQRQANRLLAHAVGTGAEVPAPLVRRLLLLAAYHLGQHYPGTTPLVRRLLDFYNRDVWPVVYEQGAGSALGDRIPLAHLSLPLLGLGDVNYQGYRLAAADVLGLFGWEPLVLSAEAAEALLSGVSFTLAYATEAAERAAVLLRAADALSALSSDVHGATAATALAAPPTQWLEGSELPGQPWAAAPSGPDAEVFGRAALVHQALGAALAGVRPVLEAASNPAAVSALGWDALAHAVADLGSLSAQRTRGLVAGQRGLPLHLAAEPTLGFGLVALPGAASSLSTAAVELSQGTGTASSLRRLVENAEQILGIELLAATQALDLRRPARTSPALERVAAAFREHVTFVAHDRLLTPDLLRAARFVREHAWE